jgi:two-component system NtrC family response regulator
MTTLQKILVLDDEHVICDGCKLILSEKGYLVDTLTNGRLCFDILGKTAYDLLLLDMKLPHIDGMEILEMVKQKYPGTYVIVMTGYSTVKNAVSAMKLGAFDYLTKPFTDDELVLAVERALENRKLVEENQTLRKQLHARYDFSNIIGENSRMLDVFEKIKKVAPTESTVLIEGESGTGKELVARALHINSLRASRQFVAVDCSTFSTTLMESELFGHVKGAFTGAVNGKPGIFEIANGATLFLDEVANLSMEIQGKLLRVMESHEYKPVGGNHIKKTDVRIIAATNRDLLKKVENGSFREDLYYRLSVFPIFIPPLREKKDDIPRLAYHFLRMFSRETGKNIKGYTDDAMEMLVGYDWPGNIRQLKNIVERLVIMGDGNFLDSYCLTNQLRIKHCVGEDDAIPESLIELKALKKHLIENRYGDIEKAFLLKALKASEGNVTRAAAQVGMQRSNFHSLMKKHHVRAKAAHKKGNGED